MNSKIFNFLFPTLLIMFPKISFGNNFESCQKALNETTTICQQAGVKARALEAIAARKARLNVDAEAGQDVMGKSAAEAGGVTGAANADSGVTCDGAFNICDKTCLAAVKYHQGLAETATDNNTIITQNNFAAKSEELKKNCIASKAKSEISKIAATDAFGYMQAGNRTADAASGLGGTQPPQQEGWFSRNWQGLAAGAAAGFLLPKLFEDDEEDNANTSNNNSSGGGSGGSGGGSSTLTGGVDCTVAENVTKTECESSMLTGCGTNPSGTNCTAFTDNYCGFNPGAANSSTQFATNGSSTYCKNQRSVRFCSTAGRTMCPSCQELQAMSTPECKSNPQICIGQNSPQQVAQAQQICPSDPKFSDPEFLATLHNNPTSGSNNNNSSGSVTLPYGGGNSGTTISNGDGQTVASISATRNVASPASVGGYSGGNSLMGGNTQGATAASVAFNQAANGQVGSQYGPSIFSMASQPIAGQCQAGQLNGCGALTGSAGSAGSAGTN